MPHPPRNPRRAYDHGREIPPATIGNHLKQGLRTVAASCADCQHEAVVDVTVFPADYPVPDVALKLRCSSCGSKQTRVRLNAAEFYEVIRQRRASGQVRGRGSSHLAPEKRSNGASRAWKL